MSGVGALVGAGPGDPQLLTRAAYDRLERAELVLYDALYTWCASLQTERHGWNPQALQNEMRR